MSNMLTPLGHIADVTLTEQQDWWLPICAYVVADTQPNATELETGAYIDNIMTTVLEQLYPADFKPATFERTFKNSVYPCGILLQERVRLDGKPDKTLRKIVTRMQREIVKSTPKQRPPFPEMQSFLINAALISVDGESEVYATFKQTFLDILNNCAMVTDLNDKIGLQNWIFGNDRRKSEPSIMYLLNTEVRRAWCAFLKAYYNEPALNDPSAFATMNEFKRFFKAKHAHFVDQYCNAYSTKRQRTVDSSTLKFDDGKWNTTVFVPKTVLGESTLSYDDAATDYPHLDACAMNRWCKWTRAELKDEDTLKTIFSNDNPPAEEDSIAVRTADEPFAVRNPTDNLQKLKAAPTRLTIVEYLNLLLYLNNKHKNTLLHLKEMTEVDRYDDAIAKSKSETRPFTRSGKSAMDDAIKAYVERIGMSPEEAKSKWLKYGASGIINTLADTLKLAVDHGGSPTNAPATQGSALGHNSTWPSAPVPPTDRGTKKQTVPSPTTPRKKQAEKTAPPPRPPVPAPALGHDSTQGAKKQTVPPPITPRKKKAKKTAPPTKSRKKQTAPPSPTTVPSSLVPGSKDQLFVAMHAVEDAIGALVCTLTEKCDDESVRENVNKCIDELKVLQDDEESQLELHGRGEARLINNHYIQLYKFANGFYDIENNGEWRYHDTETDWDAEANELAICMIRRLNYIGSSRR